MMSSAQVRDLLAAHGDLSEQSVSDWVGPFPLPTPLQVFYRDIGPVDIDIEGFGNPTHIPRLSRLWEFQNGYRWNGLSGKLIDDWDDDWLVIASESGNPFIWSRSSHTVSFAFCGAGVWEPFFYFPDVNTMAACLATLGTLVLSAGDDLADNDCVIRPEHRMEAVNRLAEILGSLSKAESLITALGY